MPAKLLKMDQSNFDRIKHGCQNFLSGDYMIPACRDEILASPAERGFTLQLHVEIKFRPGQAGQFSTWYLIRFACIFFRSFFVSMSFYKAED